MVVMKNLHSQIAMPLSLLAAMTLGACANQAPVKEHNLQVSVNPAIQPEQVAATVNGRAIGKLALEMPQQNRSHPGASEQMLDEVIARELIRQEFAGQDLSADPEFAQRVDNVLRMTFSQLAAEQYMKTIAVSDEELRKNYDDKLKTLKPQLQYKARHILVESEAEAKKIIDKLAKGSKFGDLAKKLSKDPGSKEAEGDLGWVDAGALDQAFASALTTLKNGETSTQPVQTQFGWHVIWREDAKEQPFPAFEAVKDKILMSARVEKFQKHVEELKNKAQITKPAATKAEPAAAPVEGK